VTLYRLVELLLYPVSHYSLYRIAQSISEIASAYILQISLSAAHREKKPLRK